MEIFHVEKTSPGQLDSSNQPPSYLFSTFENPKPQLQLKTSTSTHKIKSRFTLRQDTHKGM